MSSSFPGQSQLVQTPPNHLRIWHYRLTFEALDKLVFPAGKATNTIRGALGMAFRQLGCDPGCSDSKACLQPGTCAYQRVFEPRGSTDDTKAVGPKPSGFADPPRPFVLRAHHLDGCTFASGNTFDIDFILFDGSPEVQRWCIEAFEKMAAAGLGPTAATSRLTQVTEVSTNSARDKNSEGVLLPAVDSVVSPTNTLTVRFVTPTELKGADGLLQEPNFGVLLRRLRDRISNLRTFYQGGPLELDFEEWGHAADQVRLTRSSLTQVTVERRSSKTGQRHPIGGFVGEVEYAGDLTRFVAMLKIGEWTGVGRQTVWGKGQLRISL